jgi:hypothetical protein
MRFKSGKDSSIHDKQPINLWIRIKIAILAWADSVRRRAARNRADRWEVASKGAF